MFFLSPPHSSLFSFQNRRADGDVRVFGGHSFGVVGFVRPRQESAAARMSLRAAGAAGSLAAAALQNPAAGGHLPHQMLQEGIRGERDEEYRLFAGENAIVSTHRSPVGESAAINPHISQNRWGSKMRKGDWGGERIENERENENAIEN